MANSLLERSTTTDILLIQVGVLAMGAMDGRSTSASPSGTLVSFQALLLLLSNNLLYVMQFMPSLHSGPGLDSRASNSALRSRRNSRRAPGARGPRPNVGTIEFREVSLRLLARTIRSSTAISLVHSSPPHRLARSSESSGSQEEHPSQSADALLRPRFRLHHRRRSGYPRLFPRLSGGSASGLCFQESLLFDQPLHRKHPHGPAAEAPERRSTSTPPAMPKSIAIIETFAREVTPCLRVSAADASGGSAAAYLHRPRHSAQRPNVLVLDEATSALDPGTEASIHATIGRLAKGRTCISVTHRLATGAAAADMIFVFDHRRIGSSPAPTPDLLALGGPLRCALATTSSGFRTLAAMARTRQSAPDRAGRRFRS